MITPARILAFASIAVIALTIAADTAAARQRWRDIGRCYPAVEGIASATGVFGQGTAKARISARRDWQRKAAAQYGPSFASLNRARHVQWDCKKGAILLAKCVVTAEPCGARIRG